MVMIRETNGRFNFAFLLCKRSAFFSLSFPWKYCGYRRVLGVEPCSRAAMWLRPFSSQLAGKLTPIRAVKGADEEQ